MASTGGDDVRPATTTTAGYLVGRLTVAGHLVEPEQRQDSVHDQLVDLTEIARHAGLYDAADWLRARLEQWNETE